MHLFPLDCCRQRAFRHAPELLTSIEEPEALQLVQMRLGGFQQKFDGRRLP